MKKMNLRNVTILGLCLSAALFTGCPDPNSGSNSNNDYMIPQELIASSDVKKGETTPVFNKGIENIKIPDWKKNESGIVNVPASITDGSGTNVTKELKAGLKMEKKSTSVPVRNIIVMFFDGLSDDLIASSEKKYGELILNDLTVKMNLKAVAEGDNSSLENVADYYLRDTCYKKSAYGTTGCIDNPVFRNFITNESESVTSDDLVEKIFLQKAVYMQGKDNANGKMKFLTSQASNNYTNEVYKSSLKFVTDFKDSLDIFGNDSVFIEGMNSSHPDKYVTANSLFCVYENSATKYPSPVQIAKYGIAWAQSKDKSDGFFFVLYDDTKTSDRENDLRNFDEAVAVAAKYVLENPDTVLLVTSAATDGSTIPAFAYGNTASDNSTSTSVIDFIKNTIQEL